MLGLDRRALMMLAAAGLSPHARAAAPTAALRFPRDFGAHPAQRLEWWYLTGILDGSDRKPRYGYQLTFFRIKGPAAADHPSRFAARQLLLGHAALSDFAAGKLHHDQRIARAWPDLATAADGDTDVRLRGWSLKRSATGYAARFAIDRGFALELELATTQPVLVQGQGGFSRKGPTPDQFSHYYSQVQLATRARLSADGREQRLAGRSWLDHEWSDLLLGAPGVDRAVGWDWLGINLRDGGALTLFRLRRADGSMLWAGGSWRRADGATQAFEPGDVSMRPLRHWTSPVSGASYPVEWRLSSPLGELGLAALIDAQEIDARMSTGFLYWEGAARLSDAAGAAVGLGYLEMTGYAGTLNLP